MKYHSEIIKEIIVTKGHSKSLLRYESECVETWIEEATSQNLMSFANIIEEE